VSWNSGPTGTIAAESSGIKIFPNPASDILNIESLVDEVISKITLTDLLGRQIKIDQSGNNQFMQINLLGQASGLHLIRVYNEAGKMVAQEKIFLLNK